MVRRALLRNFGEDHSYTDYNLEIKRAAVDDTTLSSIMWGDKEILAGAKKDYVVYRNSPLDKLPDIVIERNSVHQNVNVTRNGDVISIVSAICVAPFRASRGVTDSPPAWSAPRIRRPLWRRCARNARTRIRLSS